MLPRLLQSIAMWVRLLYLAVVLLAEPRDSDWYGRRAEVADCAEDSKILQLIAGGSAAALMPQAPKGNFLRALEDDVLPVVSRGFCWREQQSRSRCGSVLGFGEVKKVDRVWAAFCLPMLSTSIIENAGIQSTEGKGDKVWAWCLAPCRALTLHCRRSPRQDCG
jgi:hypothetical protein